MEYANPMNSGSNGRSSCSGTRALVKVVDTNNKKLATIVEGDPKAPFSIATTPRYRGGRYSIPWIIHQYYTNNNHSNRSGKNRNRRVIWFNPPFCKLTIMNIGKYFLNLLDKHFNRDNSLRKF